MATIYQRLSFGIHSWSVEGVARDDIDINGQVPLERSYLRCFTRRLATYYRMRLGR